MAIKFYRTNEKYGCFSNFYKHGFELDGKWWPSSEHYFQAQKFYGTEAEETIRTIDSAFGAAQLGRSLQLPLRRDWENVKDDVMRKAVYAKFSQNAELKRILLDTGDELLIENTTNDYYWGCGTNGNGKNMLGLILMEVRDRLRASQIDTYFVQIKTDTGEIFNGVKTAAEIISSVDMQDCSGEQMAVFMTTAFGTVVPLEVKGCWHKPDDPLLIECVDPNGNVIITGYGTDH